MMSEEEQSPPTEPSLAERGRRVLDDSQILAAGRNVAERTATAVRNSRLYNWLTAEPETEVIVIDLRETWTIGPFIKLLDWAIETTRPWYRESTLKDGVDAVIGLGERAAETRPGQLTIALLEPPEPPAEDQKEARESDRGNERRTK
jgi:hypothetical protein